MKKLHLLTVALLFICVANAGPASAGQSKFGMTWNVTAPTGDTHDFVSGVHFRGGSLEWYNFRSRNVAFGLNAGWNVFNDNFDGTADNGTFAVTGKSWRYVNAIPIYASWRQYQSIDRRGKRMFFGLNAGTAHIERRVEMGLFQANEENWHLAVAPEVGLQLPWDSFVGSITLRYNYALSAGDANAQQWIEWRVGFGMD